MQTLILFVLTFTFVTISQVHAMPIEEVLNNLIDARSGNKILLDPKKTKGVIFFSLMAGCPIVRKYEPVILKTQKKYKDKIVILNIDSSVNAWEERLETIKYLNSSNNDLPLIIDLKSKIAHHFNLSVASEVAFIDLQDNKLKYKGAIDDRVTINFDRPEPLNFYLENVIDQVLSNKSTNYNETKASGCIINLSPK